MEKTRLQDLVIGVLVFALGVWAWVNTGVMPETTRHYTLCVTILFTFLGFLLIVQSIIKRRIPMPGGKVEAKTLGSPLLTFGLIVVYALLLDVIGFFVTSSVFMAVMIYFLGYRKLLRATVTIIGMMGFIYILFVYQLNVALPAGILF